MEQAASLPLGVLGGGAAKYNLRLVEQAFRGHYPIDADIRALVVSQATQIVRSAKSARTRLAAMRVLIAADQVNVRREANEIGERGQDLAAQTDKIRATLSSPEARKALVALTAATLGQTSDSADGP